MSIFKRKKNENGAIAVMAAFVITALVCITALAIDFGLYYYNSAKLQNAVDAAATAVAANFDSTDLSQEQIAKSYLKKNGFDVDGEYADSFHITIDKKGILDAETTDEEKYITTGYIKLTVDVDENAVFANILNLKSLHLRKTAFVKCEANYTAIPRALKYSLFAGTSGGTQANPALVIRGRTGNVTNFIVSEFEGLINGINANIVQPIIGIFGGTPNLNDLVHINLSEVITNGDVHSNSNIKISAQAINASRVKDQDYEGTESNDDAYESISKTDDNEYDDYGQVTYTSVGPIQFSNSNINTGNDSATHVYVQNQQYLEQTQNVLTVLNKMNLSTISSTAELQNKYEEEANEYLNNMGGITESQKTAIINQKDNMTYDDSTKTISLDNQSMLVYDVSQLTANSMLAKAQEQTLSGVVQEIENNGIDPLYGEQLNEDGSKKLLFQNYADKKDNNGIDYGIQIVHKDEEGNSLPTVNVDVKGTLVRRDLGNAGLGANDTNSATASAAKFAVARTFQQNLGEDGYISVPNMKPYFVRQVNKSIRNSTKTKEELGDSEALGSRTVKEAVAKMSSNLGDTLNKISYNDDTYRGDNFNSLITKDTTPFFTRYKSGKDDSLVDVTGSYHTTFNGVKLYNSDDELRTASDNVKDFAKKNIEPDEDGESNYGKGAVKKYFDNNIANNDDATKAKYATNYSADAVQRKRDEIEASFSDAYNEKKNSVNSSYKANLPSMINVFLGDTEVNPNRSYFNNQVSDINYLLTSTFTDKYTPTVNTSSYTVTMKDGFYFADGSSSKTFTNIVSDSNTRDMTNKFFTSGNTWQGNKNWLGQWQNQSSYLTGDNASTVIVGDITNARGNIDVGQD
ncbi:MAG: TadE/TadG family type IV pilus assembly protein, partial [Eubacterium sp.]